MRNANDSSHMSGWFDSLSDVTWGGEAHSNVKNFGNLSTGTVNKAKMAGTKIWRTRGLEGRTSE